MADIAARDVMTKDVTTVTEDLSVEGMLQQIRETRYRGLPVVDANGKAIGLISQNDVLRGLAYLLGSGDLPADFQSGRRSAGGGCGQGGPSGRRGSISHSARQGVHDAEPGVLQSRHSRGRSPQNHGREAYSPRGCSGRRR